MQKLRLVGAFVITLAVPWPRSALPQKRATLPTRPGPVPNASTEVAPAPALRNLIDRYCVSCHSAKLRTAGIALDHFDPVTAGEHADIWEKVARKLRSQEMPPPGLPRPNPVEYQAAA